MIDHQPTKKYMREIDIEPIDAKIFMKIKSAYQLINCAQYDEALDVLWNLTRRSTMDSSENALIFQTYGYLYAQRGEHAKAIDFFELALRLNTLSETAMLSILYITAQLYHTCGDYKKVVETLKEWMAMSSNIDSNAFILMASAHSELNNFEVALAFVEKAIVDRSSPEESWLQFLLALQYELKKYNDAVATLNLLVEGFPGRLNYWRELSNLYLQLDVVERALFTLKLAQDARLLELESEIFSFVSLYLDQRRPTLGARLLDLALREGLIANDAKSYEILAGAWKAAGESKLCEAAMKLATTLDSKESIVS